MNNRCGVCGSSTIAAFTTTDRNRRLSSERFHYVRCTKCATIALADVPDDLGSYYPNDYYRLPANRAELIGGDLRAEREKLSAVQRFVPSGRLLEIGPAIGGFVATASDAGYTAEAIEMDERCCVFLRDELGVKTVCSNDAAAVLPTLGSFDVIALWQVIEHLEDPGEVLAAAARALVPGGVLAVAAPNPEAFQLRVFKRRWTHIDAPRHLSLISVDTLAGLAGQHGLELVFATTDDYSARGWNSFGWRESLAGMVSGQTSARVLRFVGSVIGRLVSPFERRGRRGATYTAILRRTADPAP